MKSSSTVVWGVRLFTLCGCIILSVTSALGLRPQRMQVTASYHNDVSRPLREMAAMDNPVRQQEREAAENPKIPNSHVDSPDLVIETGSVLHLLAPSIPAPILNFDGIPFPGVGCSCAPPDTNGAVGLTQYVQMVNEGYQVFDKTTGNSVLGPNSIVSLWSGFGGACETGGFGDPVVLYDQLADRWVISQFASATGGTPITDECVAVSTSGDATGTYNRYGFHLGSNFFDYPQALRLAGRVLHEHERVQLRRHGLPRSASRSPSIGPRCSRALLRPSSARSVRSAARFRPFCRPTSTVSPCRPPARRTRFSASRAATNTRPITFMWTSPPRPTQPSPLSPLLQRRALPSFVPSRAPACLQSGVTPPNKLDGIGDRLMFRLAYRNFGDHESLVGNFSVKSERRRRHSLV